MFAFEFTILFITALSTAGRYGLIITEKFIVRKQINARGLARQAERAAEQRVNRDLSEIQPQDNDEDEDEELDLVWEEKGTWMFYLELGTGKFHSEISCIALLTQDRFSKTSNLPRVLLHRPYILRSSTPHHKRCLYYSPILYFPDS